MAPESILKAIQSMKLDVPSQDYVEVKMSHLEVLLRYIREIEKVSDGRMRAIENLKNKISMMNSVTEDLIVKKKLDTYI